MQHQNDAVQGCLEIIIDLVFQEPTFFLTWGTSYYCNTLILFSGKLLLRAVTVE